MSDNGWIKLHRRLLNSAVFDDEGLLKVWIWCLLRANHKPSKILFAGGEIEVKVGQFITGRITGAKGNKMKTSTFWWRVLKLEKLRNLDIKSDNKKSLITIVNWERYQIDCLDIDTNLDNKLTTSQQQVDNKLTQTRREERKNERMEEDTLMSVSPKPKTDVRVKEVFDFYLQTFGKSAANYKLTETRKAKIKARLEDSTMDEIKQALLNQFHDPWCNGANPNDTKYLDIDLVIRKREQVEKYRDKIPLHKPVPKPAPVILTGAKREAAIKERMKIIDQRAPDDGGTWDYPEQLEDMAKIELRREGVIE